MYLQFEDSLYHKNIPKYAAHILKNQQFPTHVIPKSEKDSHLYVIIDRASTEGANVNLRI